MIARYKVVVFGLVASVLVVILPACTALNTFPQAARGGDTVTLAVGSADGMTVANTTASYESDASPGVFTDLTPGIRSVFRLYADKTSSLYAIGSTANNIVITSGHEPWITVMVVDLPQGLPVGPGKVNISTTATYPTIGSHINNLPVKLEILPGTGAVSNLDYEFGKGSSMPGDLSLLESMPHAQVIPVFPQSTSWPQYGAIEMNISVPTSTGTPVRVVFDDLRVVTPTSISTLYARDSNQDMTVMLLSPKGKLHYYAPRFSLVLVDLENQVDSFLSTPVINSVRYFDTSGNLVAGPSVSDFSVEMR